MRQERLRIEPRLNGDMQRAPRSALSSVSQSIGSSNQFPSRMQSDAQILMQYDANKHSMLLAYVLWLFVGMFGVHRFYLRWPGGAIILIATMLSIFLSITMGIFGPFLVLANLKLPTYFFVFIVGYAGVALVALWVLCDAFRIPGKVRAFNMALIRSLR